MSSAASKKKKKSSQNAAEKLRNYRWLIEVGFEAYGVSFGIRSNSVKIVNEFLEILPNVLPTGWNEFKGGAASNIFSIITQNSQSETRRSKHNFFYKNEELIMENFSRRDLIQTLDSQIRLTVGEFAAEDVFLHAGAVGWNGRAIIIPGSSFSGKTTLVAEFVKRGATYYSDDFTILDKNGLVHPFPKKLSLRGIIDDYRQLDFTVEELGGIGGTEPIPVGYVLLTRFEKKAEVQLKPVTAGEAVMAALANSLSVRQNPPLVLKVLQKAFSDARFYKSDRGEASKFVDRFIDLLEGKK